MTNFKNSFVILGSSSGLPQAARATSGYLLKVGDNYSLIDCGGGVTKSFLTTGADPLKVNRIFISHTHPDHVCELPLFIQLIYLKGRQKQLDVYLPSEFVDIFEKYLYAVYLWRERMPFDLNLFGYEAGYEFESEFKISAYNTNHLKKYANDMPKIPIPNKLQCHCFQIEVNNKKLFYSADIDSLEEIRKFFNGNDFVVVETTHLDLQEFFEQSADFEVGQFVLTHLGTPDDVESIRKTIDKMNIDNILIASDGLELEL